MPLPTHIDLTPCGRNPQSPSSNPSRAQRTDLSAKLRRAFGRQSGQQTLPITAPPENNDAAIACGVKVLLVGDRGLEPRTSSLSGMRSNHLS
jgi:hypothetical protein